MSISAEKHDISPPQFKEWKDKIILLSGDIIWLGHY